MATGYIPAQKNNPGSFVATTSVWDLGQIPDLNSPEFKELLVRLYQNVNNIAHVLNLKDTGYYINQEFVTGAQYFNLVNTNPLNLRPVFRLTINIGPLGAGTTTTPHGLTIGSTWTFVKIMGTASDNIGFNYYPIPWAGGGALDIIITVNATDVIIVNNSGISFTSCYVVLEYLKQ